MDNLKINSSMCNRVALAIISFLDAVEATNKGAKDQIAALARRFKSAFKITPDMIADQTVPNLLDLLDDQDQPSTSSCPPPTTQEMIVNKTVPNLFDLLDDQDQPSTSSCPPPTKSKENRQGKGRTKLADHSSGMRREWLNRIKHEVSINGGLIHSDDKLAVDTIVSRMFNYALPVLLQKGHLTFKKIAEAFLDLGNEAMGMQKQYGFAVQSYSFAIALARENPVGYLSRGKALVALERYDQAIADFSQTILLNPKYIEAYYQRGLAYIQLGKYYEAFSDGFIPALELDPTHQHALNKIDKHGKELHIVVDKLYSKCVAKNDQ